MKKITKNLLLFLSIGALAIGTLSIVTSCSDDGGGGESASQMCDIDQCKSNSDLKDRCIDAVERCFEIDQGGHDECQVVAIDICGL